MNNKTENALNWIWHRTRSQLEKVTLPEIKRAYFDATGPLEVDCLVGIDWEAIRSELLVRLHPPTQLPQNAYQAISRLRLEEGNYVITLKWP